MRLLSSLQNRQVLSGNRNGCFLGCAAPRNNTLCVIPVMLSKALQVNIGKERTDRLSLSCPRFAHEKLAFVDDSDLNPLPYQAKHAAIADALFDHLHELLSHDRVEVRGDV